MVDEGLCFTPATTLRELIRSGQLSSRELVETVINRAETLNPKLNAICTPAFEAAHDAAKRADAKLAAAQPLGVLEGIPVTIKDLVMTKGIRSMAGSFIFEHRVPDADAPIVERLRRAGAIMIGKTTTPEFGWKGCGDSPLTGISHNPWKHGYNAGGSSTGAGICAAAGIGPLHQGSDGAGSIRMPASFCGVFGFKPTFGRIPYAPAPNNDMVSHIGPMTRTVGDAALMMDVLAGPDDRDMASMTDEPSGFLHALETDITGLRVAWSPDLGYLKVDDEVAGPVRKAVAAFTELGCHVEEVGKLWDDPTEMHRTFWVSNFAGNLGLLLDQWQDRMDPGLVACVRDGLSVTAAEYVRAKQERLNFYAKVQDLFTRYDLLVTPTMSVAAFPVGQLMPEHWEQHAWDWLRWAGFSYPFNLTWLPASTCPCGFTADGRPVGLQIVGARRQDLRVLQASRAFERARPWAGRRPVL